MDIPVDVINAAETVHRYCEEHNLKKWVVGGCASRSWLEQVQEQRDNLLSVLIYWRDECTGAEPSISVFERMMDLAISGISRSVTCEWKRDKHPDMEGTYEGK
jgi:hypothetical protein